MQNLAEQLRRLAASDDIKLIRGDAHAAFDRVWKSGVMTRTQAYKWLAARMGLTDSQTHIALFDARQCEQVIKLATEFFDEHPLG
jgi:hypothetical protein